MYIIGPCEFPILFILQYRVIKSIYKFHDEKNQQATSFNKEEMRTKQIFKDVNQDTLRFLKKKSKCIKFHENLACIMFHEKEYHDN